MHRGFADWGKTAPFERRKGCGTSPFLALSKLRRSEAAGHAAPGQEENYADEDEGEAQTGPEAEGSPTEVEAEPVAEGEADDPVSDQVTEHGGAGVACAAECAGGHGLYAVEELEGGSGEEKIGGGVNYVGGGSVHASDGARGNEERRACAGHERSS
jgi:hypothetical protein